ncbi:MAG: hypothetical protein DMF81_21105 [Acidobacteria bacterium]|nr:MAG: hypothetical protein DMF81_21105 [Acidobacteriota bacterium]
MRPCPATSRRATPPSRETVQISPAKSNAIASRESVGCWRRSDGAGAAGAMNAAPRTNPSGTMAIFLITVPSLPDRTSHCT